MMRPQRLIEFVSHGAGPVGFAGAYAAVGSQEIKWSESTGYIFIFTTPLGHRRSLVKGRCIAVWFILAETCPLGYCTFSCPEDA